MLSFQLLYKSDLVFMAIISHNAIHCIEEFGLDYCTLAKEGPWTGRWADIRGISIAFIRERAPK